MTSPEEGAWRTWLRRHSHIEDDEHAAFIDGYRAGAAETEALRVVLDRASWAAGLSGAAGELLAPYRRLERATRPTNRGHGNE